MMQLLSIVASMVLLQQPTIQGVVTNLDQEPLKNITVIAQQYTISDTTVTAANGAYSIRLRQEPTEDISNSAELFAASWIGDRIEFQVPLTATNQTIQIFNLGGKLIAAITNSNQQTRISWQPPIKQSFYWAKLQPSNQVIKIGYLLNTIPTKVEFAPVNRTVRMIFKSGSYYTNAKDYIISGSTQINVTLLPIPLKVVEYAIAHGYSMGDDFETIVKLLPLERPSGLTEYDRIFIDLMLYNRTNNTEFLKYAEDGMIEQFELVRIPKNTVRIVSKANAPRDYPYQYLDWNDGYIAQEQKLYYDKMVPNPNSPQAPDDMKLTDNLQLRTANRLAALANPDWEDILEAVSFEVVQYLTEQNQGLHTTYGGSLTNPLWGAVRMSLLMQKYLKEHNLRGYAVPWKAALADVDPNNPRGPYNHWVAGVANREVQWVGIMEPQKIRNYYWIHSPYYAGTDATTSTLQIEYDELLARFGSEKTLKLMMDLIQTSTLADAANFSPQYPDKVAIIEETARYLVNDIINNYYQPGATETTLTWRCMAALRTYYVENLGYFLLVYRDDSSMNMDDAYKIYLCDIETYKYIYRGWPFTPPEQVGWDLP